MVVHWIHHPLSVAKGTIPHSEIQPIGTWSRRLLWTSPQDMACQAEFLSLLCGTTSTHHWPTWTPCLWTGIDQELQAQIESSTLQSDFETTTYSRTTIQFAILYNRTNWKHRHSEVLRSQPTQWPMQSHRSLDQTSRFIQSTIQTWQQHKRQIWSRQTPPIQHNLLGFAISHVSLLWTTWRTTPHPGYDIGDQGHWVPRRTQTTY